MKRVALVTNIAAGNVSGGFSAMNQAMLDFLSRGYVVDYVGPVNPKRILWQKGLSKGGRILGLGGSFFFFSESRLEAIRKTVEKRLYKSHAELAIFHGFTPWIHTHPVLPYVAWSDCTFWQYVQIYHDVSQFLIEDLDRIKEREIAWLRKAERVIFRSAWAASEAIRDYNLDEARVGVVGNFGYVTPPASDSYEGGLDFLMVTTDFRQKGGRVVAEAFLQVHKNYPGTRLLIVGDDPGWRVRRRPGVAYLGWIDKSNPDQRNLLNRTIARARCLLHPTTADINPTVLIEAGFFGCPAISTERCAIPELVRDGVSGLLLDDPTDVARLVGAMDWMLREEESYRRMRKEARANMLGRYTRELFERRLAEQIARAERSLEKRASAPRLGKASFSMKTCTDGRELNVSIVEPSGLLYGSELALLDILEALDRRRFNAEVILPAGAPFSDRLRASGIPFLELLQPVAQRVSKLSKLLTYFRLARYWRVRRPDLVYVNQGGILRPIAAIAKLLKLPVLCQVQTLEDAGWVSGLVRAHPYVSSFVCNSHFIAEATKVPQERRSVVYYGYKAKGLRPKRPHGTRKPFKIGLLGRICENKGHYLVIEAARRLKAASSAEFHFRFIGGATSDRELQRIHGLVESCGLGQMIEFRGYQSDIGAEFEALDLLIVPSLAEPLGRVLFEAAEARLPALVSNQGGLEEVSSFFGAGVQFESGNVDDFLRKLKQVAGQYEESWREFDAAAQGMLASLSLATYVQVIQQLLESVAAHQPASVVWRGNKFAEEAVHR